MPYPFKLRLKAFSAEVEDKPESDSKKALTPAERKRLSRQKKKELMTDQQRTEHLKKEKERVRQIRNKKNSTKDGRAAVSLKYREWNVAKRKDISTQKKVALRKKDAERKKTKRATERLTVPDLIEANELQYIPGDMVDKPDEIVQKTPHRQTQWRKKTKAKAALSVVSPDTRVKVLCESISNSTPRTKEKLEAAGLIVQPDANKILCNLQEKFAAVSNKRDNVTNAARKAILQSVSGQNLTGRGISRMLGVRRSLANAAISSRMANTMQFQISLRQAPRSSRISDEIRKSVIEFYYRPEISRELPGKNDQVTVVNPNDGTKERVSKKILEVSLTEAYNEYKKEFPLNKIGHSMFEKLRPRDVTFAKLHHRQVCCCIYHVNIELLLKKLNQLSINNGGKSIYITTHQMVDSTLCGKNIDCITRQCTNCGTEIFSDSLPKLKCRRSCELPDCINCAITWETYEYVDYIDKKNQKKKKLGLVTKTETVNNFIESIKVKLKPFSLHRFMAGHQHEQYRLMAQNLKHDEILSIMDFAENYAVTVPNEVQSLHWVNIQVTLYVVVLSRHARLDLDGFYSTADNPRLVDEHHIFISEDRNHDYHMVEHCKKLMIDGLPFKPSRSIEFCDGASSQFKSINALAYLSQSEERYSEMATIRFWWETSHGKHKADGAGGVVKNAASMAVVRKDELIRTPEELMYFCEKELSKVNSSTSSFSSRQTNAKTVKRKFYNVKTSDIDRSADFVSYKTLSGTRSLHEARSVGSSGEIEVRFRGCACYSCLSNSNRDCTNSNLVDSLVRKNLLSNSTVLTVHDDQESSEDECVIEEEYFQPDLTELITENSIVAVRTDEELTPYFLLKVTKPPHILVSPICDDYKNEFSEGSSVVCGHYFELVAKQNFVFYIDHEHVAYINVRCILPTVSRELLSLGDKKVKGKMRQTYKLTLDHHEELLSFMY